MLEKLKDYLAKYGAIIIFAIIAVVIVMFFLMRNKIINLKQDIKFQEKEISRIQDNYEAANDTIRVFRDKNGNMVSEISAYKIKINELNTKYSNLFTLYTKEKNKPPVVVVEYRTKIDEKIVNVSTLVSDTAISFIDSVRYNDGNYRSIKGTIPYKLTYHIKKDMVNKFAFEQALYYAYVMEESGCKDTKVVAFKDNKIIPIKEALAYKDPKGIIYKVYIYESNQNMTLKEISDIFKVDEKLLTSRYENGITKYYIGNIVPFSNIEPIIDGKDLNTYTDLKTFPATLNFSQGMTVNTGLYKDLKTGKVMINVKSNYPGLNFTNIVGADIMEDPVSRKIARSFRREFGVGLHLGYGFFLVPDANKNYVIRKGPAVSVGLNWSPKFLQFGSSKK